MGLMLYREQQLLTRVPTPPAVPMNATVSSPMAGNDFPKVVEGTAVSGDGLKTGGVAAIFVTCIAETGQTLSGGGALEAWVWSPDEFLWTRAPDIDLSMAWLGVTPRRARVFPSLRIPTRAGGRVNFLANGVTVSGGTTVLVRIQGEASWHAS